MTAARNDQAYEVTWLVRRLFRAMGARANLYLADSDLTANDRAVMEFLYASDPLSVPDIARRYDVSRQHIQITVNALLERGLLRSIENPNHKRSRLLRLSSLGRDTFEEIRRNEAALISDALETISDEALATTRATLASLLHHFR
jgi:DNA-binding MarR family transcriptional regulator